MTQFARTRERFPVDATGFVSRDWEALKQSSKLGDYVMPCCESPAVLKTSINGVQFFSHVSDECATAPETVWHKTGKAALLAALSSVGITGVEEMPGCSVDGDKWEADVYFEANNRKIAIELQRSYQHFREYRRRQNRYAASAVECYWLVRKETFLTLAKSTRMVLLKRDFAGAFPPGGIGTGMLPELPVSMLDMENETLVIFGGGLVASPKKWLEGILTGAYKYRGGSWNLG